MIEGTILFPAFAKASAVRGTSLNSFMTLSIRPKLLVVGVGSGMGPVVVSGSGAGSDEGVMAFVISGAVGRSSDWMLGRFVKAFVPVSKPWGGMGGLVARVGSTEAPVTDWSDETGRLLERMGVFVWAW